MEQEAECPGPGRPDEVTFVLPRRRYTFRHAAVMSGLLTGACAVWIGGAFMVGLPPHPWVALPLCIAYLGSSFFFAVLDPLGSRLVARLTSLWSIMLLICVALAAVFGGKVRPFPLWAAAPVVAVLALLALVVIWFGIRSLIRGIRSRRLTRDICTSGPLQIGLSLDTDASTPEHTESMKGHP